MNLLDSSPHWHPGDDALARRFHASTEMILWTPGKESGNPLTLQPLPDFDAVKGDAEELQDAVLMANASLSGIVAKGKTEKAEKKLSILQTSLGFFARNYAVGTLADYADMLNDLPDAAGLRREQGKGTCRRDVGRPRRADDDEPAAEYDCCYSTWPQLFWRRRARARQRGSPSSASSACWTLDMQRTFLNQLAMILFSWIKKNPNPHGRPIRGLLVIDRGQGLPPVQKSSECKESMLRLGAQARKYGLGLVFATQHPKDIEHKLIGNSSTHFYGLNNSPASLATLQEQMKLGGR